MENEIFANDKEEIAYLRKKLQDCQIELEEYQESSRELECELEAQLNLSETRNKELKNYNVRLLSENENLRNKLIKLTNQTNEQIFDLQKQLSDCQVNNAKLSRCIRELEQSNDDLERAKRALHASLDDFEKKLNHQIEKNVLLENELGEKEQLEVIIQRLKDEARDLKQELLVQQQPNHHNFKVDVVVNEEDEEEEDEDKEQEDKKIKKEKIKCLPKRPNSLYYDEPKKLSNLNLNNNNKLINECSKINSTNNNNSSNNLPSSLLSPSTRISVLNIVSDLLRKVGTLESKLASCKTIGSNASSSNSPIKNGLNCPNSHFG